MDNKTYASLFEDVAKIKGKENRFKMFAFQKVAKIILALDKPIENIPENELCEIKGIGDSAVALIKEIKETGGKLPIISENQAILKPPYEELLKLEGVGEAKAEQIYKEMGIKTVDDLKNAISSGTIFKIFKQKTVDNLKRSLDYMDKTKGRIYLSEALLKADTVIDSLLSQVKEADIKIYPMNDAGVSKFAIATGSVRRHKEMPQDIDILICTDENKHQDLANLFIKLPWVDDVIKVGTTPSVWFEGTKIDLIITTPTSWASALQHQTGSQLHNERLRGEFAKPKGLKSNQYGLWVVDDKGNEIRQIPIKDEEELYNLLGLYWIPPEEREGTFEFEKYLLKNPKPEYLISADIVKDLHLHTNYSDGVNSIEEIIAAAEKAGLSEIAITDHATSNSTYSYNGGMNQERAIKQIEAIKQLREIAKIKVNIGIECNISANGSLDYPLEFLKANFDIVIASIHHRTTKDLTEAYINAIKNGATILGHITGRKIEQGKDTQFTFDIEKVLDACKEYGVAIELNIARYDAPESLLRAAKAKGVKVSIGSDSHAVNGIRKVKTLGLWFARRAGLTKKDLL